MVVSCHSCCCCVAVDNVFIAATHIDKKHINKSNSNKSTFRSQSHIFIRETDGRTQIKTQISFQYFPFFIFSFFTGYMASSNS